jgi:Family of unknown function (DUF5706)
MGRDGVTSMPDELPSKTTDDIRRVAGGWIASADLKATAMLAAGCAVPALAALTGVKPGNVLSVTMLGAFCLLDVASIVASALVLFPRTNRQKILTEKGATDPLPRSITFFGDLGDLGYYELKALLNKDDSEQMRERDAMEQTLIVTWIANRKMQYMRASVACLAAASVVLVAMSFVSLVLTPDTKPQDAKPTTKAHTDAT